MGPIFELWQVRLEEIEDAGHKDIGGVKVRGLRFPYTLPANAEFQADHQVIWFDTETLLPLRWTLPVSLPEEMDYGYFFTEVPELQLGPSPQERRPNCVQPRRIIRERQ